jgi:O-Antigen ligase
MTLEAVRSHGEARSVRTRLPALAPALVAFAPIVGLAIAQGGYFPTAWGWASVPLLWVAALALVFRGDVPLTVADRVFLGLLAAFTGWVAISIAWSAAPAESVLEVERVLVYAAAGYAVLLASRARDARRVLGGVLAAISCICLFSLATRLLPDRVGVYDQSGVYRLAQPIGYWNGLALFAAMGTLLALGFAARARTLAARSVCGAALVLLLPVVYFPFGRAAWIALGAGLVAAVAFDRSRLQLLVTLLVLAPAPAIVALVASRQAGLTHAGSSLERATHDGHRLALVLILLAAANAALAAGLGVVAARVSAGANVRRTFVAALTFALIACTALVLVREGGPVHVVKRAYASFKAPPPYASSDLNRRLLSFSGNGRADLWRIAWADANRHPVLGAGAGTYERYFLAHQPADVGLVRDAHSLYVETLAEVGPLGLALLVTLLLTPLAAIVRARAHPIVPGAVGAYVAYLVHTGVDWDWELPAVTLAAFLCGTAILLAARTASRRAPLAPWLRWSLTAGALLSAAFATLALVGNASLSRSETAREQGRFEAAAVDARRARALMPWSPAPWEALGRAQLAAGYPSDAAASFRRALSDDQGDWQLWYELSTVTRGRERARSLRRVAELFPRSGLVSHAAATGSGP